MSTRASGSNVMQIEAASWLDPALLILVIKMQAPASLSGAWSVWAEHDSDDLNELDGRWLACRPEPDDAGDVLWLLTVGMPAGAPPAALVLGDGGESHRMTRESINARLSSPTRLAEAVGDSLDSASRSRAAGFLAHTAQAHARDYTPDLSERLMAIRDVLRTSLPVSKVEPGIPCSMRLELVIRIDARAFWLVGWIHTAEPNNAQFTAVSPEGARGVPRPGAISFRSAPGRGTCLW
jgi:hypothetical protein